MSTIRTAVFLTVFSLLVGCQFGQAPVGLLHVDRPSFVLPVQDLDDGNPWIFFVETVDGQGVLIKSPKNRYVIIDAGPESQGRKMAELLYRMKVSEIEAVFVTHPDNDHVGGLVSLVKELGVRVKSLYHNGFLRDIGSSDWSYMRDNTKTAPQPVKRYDEPIKIDDMVFTVLNPRQPPFVKTDDDDDNNAMVIRLQYGRHSILFTSDVRTFAERDLLDDPKMKELLKVDILQVGSHGQEVSSSDDFIKVVQPRLAIIQGSGDNSASTGRRPGEKEGRKDKTADAGQVAPLVLDALKAANPNMKILQTNEKGTIAVVFDGRKMYYRTAKDSISPTNVFPVE